MVAPEQLALFAAPSQQPQGLRFTPEFIRPDVEAQLIARISQLPLQPFQFGAYEGKRRVASFGYAYDFAARKLREAEPIPEWLTPLIKDAEAHEGADGRIAQVLCTEYEAGVGIGWHRDKPQFDRIFGLSLGSACKFRFRRKAGAKWERFTMEATPRSLYSMAGRVRSEWEHSIPAVEELRYSVTLRTMVRRRS
jgi:alkylated DNA repair dioxygenase AlkB